MATRLGRKAVDIEDALGNLTAKKLLKREGEGVEATYGFAPSAELQEQVTSFCEALEDRDKRLEILAKLLRMKATS